MFTALSALSMARSRPSRPFQVTSVLEEKFKALFKPRDGGGWQVKTPGKMIVSGEGHGGIISPPNIQARGYIHPDCLKYLVEFVKIRNDAIGSQCAIKFFIGKVIPDGSFIPGLSTVRAEDGSPVSNFGLRVPLIATILHELGKAGNWGVRANLHDVGVTAMADIKTLDGRMGLTYPTEPTSLGDVLPIDLADFYAVIDIILGADVSPADNEEFRSWFKMLCSRVLHPVPNIGELLEEDSVRRAEYVKRNPFPFYGMFIYAIYGGGLLPDNCALMFNDMGDGRVFSGDKARIAGGSEYNMYPDSETLENYNILSFSNRKDVEKIIGICNGFLEFDGEAVVGKEFAWQEYKHNQFGPIQILRRAVVYQKFTHAESLLLGTSMGMGELLLFDEACNCLEEESNIVDDSVVLDSQQTADLDVPPIPNTLLRILNDDDAALLGERRAAHIDELNSRRLKMKNAHVRALNALQIITEINAQVKPDLMQQPVVTRIRKQLIKEMRKLSSSFTSATKIAEGSDKVGFKGFRSAGQVGEYITDKLADVNRCHADGVAMYHDAMKILTRILDRVEPGSSMASMGSVPGVPGGKVSGAGGVVAPGVPPNSGKKAKKGGSRKIRKRFTRNRKKLLRRTKKRTYKNKSQKRNNRK